MIHQRPARAIRDCRNSKEKNEPKHVSPNWHIGGFLIALFTVGSMALIPNSAYAQPAAAIEGQPIPPQATSQIPTETRGSLMGVSPGSTLTPRELGDAPVTDKSVAPQFNDTSVIRTRPTITPASENLNPRSKFVNKLLLKTSVPSDDGPSTWQEVESQFVVTFEKWAEETGFEPTEKDQEIWNETGAYLGVADRPVIHTNLNIIEAPPEVVRAYRAESQELRSQDADTPQAVVKALWRHGLLLENDPVILEHLTEIIGEPRPGESVAFRKGIASGLLEPVEAARAGFRKDQLVANNGPVVFNDVVAQAGPKKGTGGVGDGPPQPPKTPKKGDVLQPTKPGGGQGGPKIAGKDPEHEGDPEPGTPKGEPIKKKCVASVMTIIELLDGKVREELSTEHNGKGKPDVKVDTKTASISARVEIIPTPKSVCSPEYGVIVSGGGLYGNISVAAAARVGKGSSASAEGEVKLAASLGGGYNPTNKKAWNWSDSVHREASVKLGAKVSGGESKFDAGLGFALVPGKKVEGKVQSQSSHFWSSDSGAQTATAAASVDTKRWHLRLNGEMKSLDIDITGEVSNSVSSVIHDGKLTQLTKEYATHKGTTRVGWKGGATYCTPIGAIEIVSCRRKDQEGIKDTATPSPTSLGG